MSEYLDIIVTNASPALRYEGDWTSSTHERAISGSLVTVAEGKKGSLFYDFTGMTQLDVQGLVTNFSQNWNKFSLEFTPRLESNIRQFAASADWATELFYLYQVRDLSPTTSYTLNFTMEGLPGTPVWFDTLLFTPAPATQLNDTLVKMQHGHPMIEYGLGWDASLFYGTIHVTNTSGSVMKLDFNGTSVKWYTNWFTVGDIANISAEASWKIDDMESHNFTVPIPDPAEIWENYRKLLFETSRLPPGLHHLEVTYHGNQSTRPLSLRDLVIQSALATAPPIIPSSIDPDSKPVTIEPGLSTGTKAAIGISTAIVVVFVAVALFLVLRMRRRDKARKGEATSLQSLQSPAYTHFPNPYVDRSRLSNLGAPSSTPTLSTFTPPTSSIFSPASKDAPALSSSVAPSYFYPDETVPILPSKDEPQPSHQLDHNDHDLLPPPYKVS